MSQVSEIHITAVVSVRQRHGFVIINQDGKDRVGIPNIDNHVDQLEPRLPEEEIYRRTGRWPTGLFVGPRLQWVKKADPDLWTDVASVTSLSDWIGWRLTGRLVYEYSQATETALLDVRTRQWDISLCDAWEVDRSLLPELAMAGVSLGQIGKDSARALGLPVGVPVIIGAADTQCSVHAIPARIGDVVIIAGSTTPVVRMVGEAILDANARLWTNCHLTPQQWLIESNCGVTGSNYEWVCRALYSDGGYAVMEREMRDASHLNGCHTALGPGPMVAKSGFPPGWGVLFLPRPIPFTLSRAFLASSVLWDMACAIRANVEQLDSIVPLHKKYRIWGVGGGFQSATLWQMITNLLQCPVSSIAGGHQASLLGAARLAMTGGGQQPNHNVDIWEFSHPSMPPNEVDKAYRNWQCWHDKMTVINQKVMRGDRM